MPMNRGSLRRQSIDDLDSDRITRAALEHRAGILAVDDGHELLHAVRRDELVRYGPRLRNVRGARGNDEGRNEQRASRDHRAVSRARVRGERARVCTRVTGTKRKMRSDLQILVGGPRLL